MQFGFARLSSNFKKAVDPTIIDKSVKGKLDFQLTTGMERATGPSVPSAVVDG